MKRIRNTLIIIEFAYRAILLIWLESKTAVSWKREYKHLNLSVNIYNHLFDKEIEELERREYKPT